MTTMKQISSRISSHPVTFLVCCRLIVSLFLPPLKINFVVFFWLLLIPIINNAEEFLRISWKEKKTNVNVLREGNVQRSLLKTIRKRQMEFLGHVCRRRGLEFLSLTGKVEGKRDRGKQRITFLDSLCNSATGGQSKSLNFLKLSDDRDVWRGMAANVCSRSGT